MKRVPNIITMTRMLLIPVVLLLAYQNHKLSNIVAGVIFSFASLTDYLDGFLARKYHAESNLGKMLDHTADKLLVSSTLMVLVYSGKAPLIPSVIILCRELLVSGLREHLAMIHITLKASRLGKIKTAMQMVSIIILLLGKKFFYYSFFVILGQVGIWAASFLTIATGYNYLKITIKEFY